MNDASDDQIHRLTDHLRAKIQEPSSVAARQASGRDQLILPLSVGNGVRQQAVQNVFPKIRHHCRGLASSQFSMRLLEGSKNKQTPR